MKRHMLCFLLILTLLCNGCFSYRDMNRLNFVSMGIFDRGSSGEIKLYTEQFAPDRGETKEGGVAKRVVLSGSGATVGDAYYNLQTLSTLPMTYEVAKAVVFTERLAREGLGEFIDGLSRDQKLTNKVFLFVTPDDPTDLMNVEVTDEQFIGVYLEEMMIFQGDQSRLLAVRANEYMNARETVGRVTILPIIQVSNQPVAQRIEVTGAEVLVDDKMVEKLSVLEVGVYKALMDQLAAGEVSAPHPEEKNKLVSLLLLKNKTKRTVELNSEKGEVLLNINIHHISSVLASQTTINLLDPKIRKELQSSFEEMLEAEALKFFERFKEKEIDILEVETMLKRKYPHAKLDNALAKTRMKVNVTIEIEGSQEKANRER